MVRLVSLENCPEGFADGDYKGCQHPESDRKKGFCRARPESETLENELYWRIRKSTPIRPGNYLTARQFGVHLRRSRSRACVQSLGCFAGGSGETREVGMLYEDITKASLHCHFQPRHDSQGSLGGSYSASKRRGRAYVSEQQAADRQGPVDCNSRKQIRSASGFSTVCQRAILQTITRPRDTENRTRELIRDSPRCYRFTMFLSTTLLHTPASLFKNATKCRDLAKRIPITSRSSRSMRRHVGAYPSALP